MVRIEHDVDARQIDCADHGVCLERQGAAFFHDVRSKAGFEAMLGVACFVLCFVIEKLALGDDPDGRKLARSRARFERIEARRRRIAEAIAGAPEDAAGAEAQVAVQETASHGTRSEK